MIKSMTGYGSASGQLGDATYIVEIKTVNNRYFKARLKLPEAVSFLEEDVEKLLQKELFRGTVNYTLRLKNVPANTLFELDETALQTYAEKLKQISGSMGIESPIDMGSLLNLPGIIMPAIPNEAQAEKVKEVTLNVTQQAIDKLKQMRAAEGAALAADLEKNCKAIKDDIEQIQSRSDLVMKEYHKKLKKRVDDLLAGAKLNLDEETLAREIAVFAERSDISEEISRLKSHLQQFAKSCETDGQAGRRLDFISQEMLREANTISSKACDTEIINWVVDMKCRIDRIKEQVQNVE